MKLRVVGGPVVGKVVVDVEETTPFSDIFKTIEQEVGKGPLWEASQLHVAELVDKKVRSQPHIIVGTDTPKSLSIPAVGGIVMIRNRKDQQSPTTSPRQGASYRDRMVAIYQKYDPAKLSTVDGSLKKFPGKEEAIIRKLVEKYGPEPDEADTGSVLTLASKDPDHPDAPQGTQRSEITSGIGSVAASALPGNTDAGGKASYRDRMIALYQKYDPAKVGTVDGSLKKFAGKEEAIIRKLVEKYGPEPAIPAKPAPSVAPSNVGGSEAGEKKPVAASEISSISSTAAAEAPAAQPAESTGASYRDRMIALYQKYDPAKVGTVDGSLKKFVGKEEAVIRKLVEKYGPEPAIPAKPAPAKPAASAAPSEKASDKGSEKGKSSAKEKVREQASDRASNPHDDVSSVSSSVLASALANSVEPGPERSYRDRMIALYEKYDPSKVGTVDGSLRKFPGKEEAVIRKLVEKYGPEPKPPAPSRSHSRSTSGATDATFERASALEAAAAASGTANLPTLPSEGQQPVKDTSSDTSVHTARPTESKLSASHAPSLAEEARESPSRTEKASETASVKSRRSNRSQDEAQPRQPPSYRERMIAMYEKYEPSKVGTVDASLRKFVGKEEAIIRKLVQKYGPEPGVPHRDDVGSVSSVSFNDSIAASSSRLSPSMRSRDSSRGRRHQTPPKDSGRQTPPQSGHATEEESGSLPPQAPQHHEAAPEQEQEPAKHGSSRSSTPSKHSQNERSASHGGANSRTPSVPPRGSDRNTRAYDDEKQDDEEEQPMTEEDERSGSDDGHHHHRPTSRSNNKDNRWNVSPGSNRKANYDTRDFEGLPSPPNRRKRHESAKRSPGRSRTGRREGPYGADGEEGRDRHRLLIKLAVETLLEKQDRVVRQDAWSKWKRLAVKRRVETYLADELWERMDSDPPMFRMKSKAGPTYVVPDLNKYCETSSIASNAVLPDAMQRPLREIFAVAAANQEEVGGSPLVLTEGQLCPVKATRETANALVQVSHIFSGAAEVRAQLRATQKKLEETREAGEELRARIANYEPYVERCNVAEAALRKLEEEHEALKTKAKQSGSELGTLKYELQFVRHELEKERRGIPTDGEKLIQQKDTSIATLQQELSKARSKVYTQQRENTTLKSQVNELQSSLANTRQLMALRGSGSANGASMNGNSRKAAGATSSPMGRKKSSANNIFAQLSASPYTVKAGGGTYLSSSSGDARYDAVAFKDGLPASNGAGLYSEADFTPDDNAKAEADLIRENMRLEAELRNLSPLGNMENRGKCPHCYTNLTSCGPPENGDPDEKAAFCFSCRKSFTFSELYSRKKHLHSTGTRKTESMERGPTIKW